MRRALGIFCLLIAAWAQAKCERHDIEWDKDGAWHEPAPEPGPATKPAIAILTITGGLCLVWPRKQQQ